MAREALSLWRRVSAVLVGGFCGTITRYLLSLLIQGWFGKALPYDIFLINITGALILAFVTTLADATFLIGPTRRLFINIGFLGAYTTFSSLALGDFQLISHSQEIYALLYFLLSLFGGVLAVMSGDWLGQKVVDKFKHSRSSRLEQAVVPPASEEHLDVQNDVILK
jgi:fluoride exporter